VASDGSNIDTNQRQTATRTRIEDHNPRRAITNHTRSSSSSSNNTATPTTTSEKVRHLQASSSPAAMQPESRSVSRIIANLEHARHGSAPGTVRSSSSICCNCRCFFRPLVSAADGGGGGGGCGGDGSGDVNRTRLETKLFSKRQRIASTTFGKKKKTRTREFRDWNRAHGSAMKTGTLRFLWHLWKRPIQAGDISRAWRTQTKLCEYSVRPLASCTHPRLQKNVPSY